jgi:hypothetical protein
VIDIGFEWTRGLKYERVRAADGKLVVRQIGRNDRPFKPLEISSETPLYLRFANLDGSPESCRAFAEAWGLLTLQARAGAAENVDGWKAEIKKMRSLVSSLGVTRGDPGGILAASPAVRIQFKITTLAVSLESQAPGERPALVMRPENLLAAMQLQLAKFVAGDGSLRVCKQCGQWFEAGPGDARRSVAVFCSERCKNRFHYLKRVSQ